MCAFGGFVGRTTGWDGVGPVIADDGYRASGVSLSSLPQGIVHGTEETSQVGVRRGDFDADELGSIVLGCGGGVEFPIEVVDVVRDILSETQTDGTEAISSQEDVVWRVA